MTSGDGPGPRLAPAVPDRWWVPAVAALVLAVGFVAVLLVRADGDVSLLVHAGPPWTSAAEARGSLTVQPADEAFDGQFFYRLGVRPWTTDEPVAGVTDDLPALRNARWGYGALAWLGSAGDPDLVPWSLVAVNVVAAAGLGAIGGGLARSLGRHAGWGVVFPLWPGFAYSLSLDTSELVAMTFALGGLLALRHRRWPVAAAALGAAVLTRDTTAALAFGVAASALVPSSVQRRLTRSTGSAAAPSRGPIVPTGRSDGSGRPPGSGGSDPAQRSARSGGAERAERFDRADRFGPLAAGGAALALFVVWQLVQRARFGELPLTSSGDNNLAAPLTGLVDLLRHSIPPGSGEEVFRLGCAALVIAVLAVGARCWPATRATWAERVAWLPAVGVVLLLNAYLWSGATAFLRASTEAGVLAALLVLGSRRRWTAPALTAAFGAVWLVVAASQVAKLG